MKIKFTRNTNGWRHKFAIFVRGFIEIFEGIAHIISFGNWLPAWTYKFVKHCMFNNWFDAGKK